MWENSDFSQFSYEVDPGVLEILDLQITLEEEDMTQK